MWLVGRLDVTRRIDTRILMLGTMKISCGCHKLNDARILMLGNTKISYGCHKMNA